MAGFVQMIEFTTSKIDEIKALSEEMTGQLGSGMATRGVVTEDRDRPGTYLNIVEFDSYESAMENSSRPEIGEFSRRMAELCDGPPTFYNLEVLQQWDESDS